MRSLVIFGEQELNDVIAPMKIPWHVVGDENTESNALPSIFEIAFEGIIVVKRQYILKELCNYFDD